MDIPCVPELCVFMISLLAAVGSSAKVQPDLEKSEIHINITAGRTAILPCMANGITSSNQNRYKIVWQNPQRRTLTYGTQRITSDQRFSVINLYNKEWNLHIRTVEPSDHGEYRCQMNTQPVQQKKVFLHVQVPPDITASPNTEVPEGETLTLYCNVTGRPTPTVTWYKDGIVIQKQSEVLEISTISRNQAGLYRCRALNAIDPGATANIIVDVLYEPEVETITQRIGQYRGKSTILECRVRANPYQNFFWMKDGEKLPELPWKYKTEVFNDNGGQIMQLRILMLDKTDFGRYYCKARNDLGSDSDVAVLLELTTDPPTTSTITSSTSTSTSSSSSATMTTTFPQSSSTRSSEQTANGKLTTNQLVTNKYPESTHKYSENPGKYGSSSSGGDGNVIEVRGRKMGTENTGTFLLNFNLYKYIVFISIPILIKNLFNT